MKLIHTAISIPAERAWLAGELAHAPEAPALALLAGPGFASQAHSREPLVAAVLQAAGFATLTLDLLTHHEEHHDPDARFNQPLLAARILAAREWIAHQPPLAFLPVVLMSADTGSGAAIRAAARDPQAFAALACRGGRPDLAGAGPLRALSTPTLFIIPGAGQDARPMEQAYALMQGPREALRMAAADDMFSTPGSLDEAAHHAAAWLRKQLPAPGSVPAPADVDRPDPH